MHRTAIRKYPQRLGKNREIFLQGTCRTASKVWQRRPRVWEGNSRHWPCTCWKWRGWIPTLWDSFGPEVLAIPNDDWCDFLASYDVCRPRCRSSFCTLPWDTGHWKASKGAPSEDQLLSDTKRPLSRVPQGLHRSQNPQLCPRQIQRGDESHRQNQEVSPAINHQIRATMQRPDKGGRWIKGQRDPKEIQSIVHKPEEYEWKLEVRCDPKWNTSDAPILPARSEKTSVRWERKRGVPWWRQLC